MRAHGVLRDEQPLRDLVRAEVLVEEQEHLDLARRQDASHLLGNAAEPTAVAHAVEEPSRDAAGERRIPSRDAAEERRDLLRRLRLQEVARTRRRESPRAGSPPRPTRSARRPRTTARARGCAGAPSARPCPASSGRAARGRAAASPPRRSPPRRPRRRRRRRSPAARGARRGRLASADGRPRSGRARSRSSYRQDARCRQGKRGSRSIPDVPLVAAGRDPARLPARVRDRAVRRQRLAEVRVRAPRRDGSRSTPSIAVVATFVCVLTSIRFLVDGRTLDLLLAAGFWSIALGTVAFGLDPGVRRRLARAVRRVAARRGAAARRRADRDRSVRRRPDGRATPRARVGRASASRSLLAIAAAGR